MASGSFPRWVGAMLFLLWVLILSGGCAADRPIPVPSGGPEALPAGVLVEAGRGVKLEERADRLALACAAEFFALSKNLREECWPFWFAWHHAVGLRTAPDRWLLVNHRDPPPGMNVVIQETVPSPVYVGLVPVGVVQEGWMDYRGRSTVVVSLCGLTSPDVPAPAVSSEVIGKVFEIAVLPGLILDPARASGPDARHPSHGVWPALGPMHHLLALLEARLLDRALENRDDFAAAQSFDGFLAIRKLRRSTLPKSAVALEQRFELQGGIPAYTRIKAFRFAARAAREPAGDFPEGDLPDYDTAAEEASSRFRAGLQTVCTLGYLEGPGAFSMTGTAQALVLDRLRPGWFTEFHRRGGRLLEEVLALENVLALEDVLDF